MNRARLSHEPDVQTARQETENKYNQYSLEYSPNGKGEQYVSTG